MNRYLAGTCLAVGLGSTLLLAHRSQAQKADGPAAELTVYQNDFALVHERRALQVAGGATTVLVDHVSHSLDPGSLIVAFTGAQAPLLVGQGYELGVADVRELLRRRVGQEVDWVRFRPDGKPGRRDKARLLAVDAEGKAVIESGGRIYADPPGQLALDAQGAATAGRLALQVDSQGAQRATLDLGYLTRDLGWSADYVLTLSADKPETGRLEAVGAVSNKTGVAFDNAQVTLMAGEPNRAAVPGEQRSWAVGGSDRNGHLRFDGAVASVAPAADAKMDTVAEAGPRAVGEQQAYPIAKPVDIASDRLTRLPMFSADAVKLARDFSYTAPHLSPWSSARNDSQRATLALAFRNSRDSGLGLAMPAGTLRAFERDSAGHLRYIGANSLRGLSADERADLALGTAFDLRVEYHATAGENDGSGRRRVTIEMKVTSARAADTVVRLVQPIDGSAQVVDGDQPGQWLDPRRAEWTLTVPASGSSAVKAVVLVAPGY